MYKYMALVAFLFGSIPVLAQDSSSVKYFDSLWTECTADRAYYKVEYNKNGAAYEAVTYMAGTGILKNIQSFVDPTYKIRSGLSRTYYASGQLEDSSYYFLDKMVLSYHYHPNGKIWVAYSYDPATRKETTLVTDSTGATINSFLYSREAAFPGGEDAWIAFVSANLNQKVPVKKKAPAGRYKAEIQFIVEPDGSLSNITPLTRQGYGIEDELIRVLKKSPKWIPAVWLNKPVKAWRRQPLTFIVPD